jgi:protease-4
MHIHSQFLWNVAESHLPVLRQKLRTMAPATVAENLPKHLQTKVANGAFDVRKAWNEYFTACYSTDPKVLVLPVMGELSRDSYWSWGYDFLTRQLASAAADEQYVGAVLKANTPGGTADGCSLFADAIAEFPKPILGWTNYCASAGYFALSQTDEIWLEDSVTTQIGSIGTLCVYENYVGWMEKQGIKVEIIRADGSQDKARVNPYEELSEEGRAEIMALLNACRREFVGYVKRGRAGVLNTNDVLTGKMYNAKDALKFGLADQRGSLAQAVRKVVSLAKAA